MAAYEVELKFRLPDADLVEQRIRDLKAEPHEAITQSDQYFAHPVRRFEQTEEALRLRSEGEANRLTYKGPYLDRTTKTRQELELEVSSGAEGARDAWALLRALGFEDVHTVRKSRRTYELVWEGRPFTLALDKVEQLGEFIEIETLAGASDWEAARDAALRLAERLHLTESERRSYLQLILELPRSGPS
jgi:adenylate cyclase class 2